jgi:hypothetical protein
MSSNSIFTNFNLFDTKPINIVIWCVIIVLIYVLFFRTKSNEGMSKRITTCTTNWAGICINPQNDRCGILGSSKACRSGCCSVGGFCGGKIGEKSKWCTNRHPTKRWVGIAEGVFDSA